MILPRLNLVELSTPVLLLSWATWFLAFNVTGDSPSFNAGQFLPNWAWALIFASAALFKAGAIVRRRRRLRLAAIAVCALLWIVAAFVFMASSPRTLLIPTALFFVYQSFLSWQKVAGQQDS